MGSERRGPLVLDRTPHPCPSRWSRIISGSTRTSHHHILYRGVRGLA